MRVFITGGTGLVGTRLVARLLARQDEPVVLTRDAGKAQKKLGPGVQVVAGDPMQPGPWQGICAGCDAVVNLVGENVTARRWNEAFKKLLIESRTVSTRHVVEALRNEGKARVLVNASAIGYYGPHGDKELDENTPPANDFFGRLCAAWEKEAFAALAFGVRVATVRVGMVLDRAGGALGKMLPMFRWGVGGRLGSGKQWMSWIHHDDLVGLFLLALDNERVTGALNGTAPNPVTNLEFTKTLGKVLNRPTWLPAPTWGLRLMLGEMAEVLVTGQRVVPRAALREGFAFQYPSLEPALRAVLA